MELLIAGAVALGLLSVGCLALAALADQFVEAEETSGDES